MFISYRNPGGQSQGDFNLDNTIFYENFLFVKQSLNQTTILLHLIKVALSSDDIQPLILNSDTKAKISSKIINTRLFSTASVSVKFRKFSPRGFSFVKRYCRMLKNCTVTPNSVPISNEEIIFVEATIVHRSWYQLNES